MFLSRFGLWRLINPFVPNAPFSGPRKHQKTIPGGRERVH